MIRRAHLIRAVAMCGLAAVPSIIHAQDTTFRGVTINGTYDPLRDKWGVVVLPVAGPRGDSVRAIVQRDLDFSDRFSIIAVDTSDVGALRGRAGVGLNYPLFARLAAAAVVEITAVPTGLHVALHDVAGTKVINVGEFPLPPTTGRDWRMAVHRTSDEIARWVTGQRGIAATRVAYLRGSALHIVDSDGAGDIAIPTAENAISPAWNPAGSSLAYTTYGLDSRLLILELATGRSRDVVSAGKNSVVQTPTFSPDGSTIVYARASESQGDLYAVTTDGGTPRRLTVARGAYNASPAFSPDGRRIVYVSNLLGRPELYVMDADGTGSDVLTNYDFSENNYRSDPDWSPDGRQVAYQERIDGRFQIRTIPITGGTPKLLTSEGENEQPSWAPDARHLVFTSTRTGVRQLWVLDSESGRLRQLTRSGGSRLAAWSPRLDGPR
jgi:TolB protein